MQCLVIMCKSTKNSKAEEFARNSKLQNPQHVTRRRSRSRVYSRATLQTFAWQVPETRGRAMLVFRGHNSGEFLTFGIPGACVDSRLLSTSIEASTWYSPGPGASFPPDIELISGLSLLLG